MATRKPRHVIKGEFYTSSGHFPTAACRADSKTAVVFGRYHRFHEIDLAAGKKIREIQVGGSTNYPSLRALARRQGRRSELQQQRHQSRAHARRLPAHGHLPRRQGTGRGLTRL